LDVEEGDAGALVGEVADERLADAGCAAGDEDDAIAKAGVNGVLVVFDHASSFG
jgi:hypothetical protein